MPDRTTEIGGWNDSFNTGLVVSHLGDPSFRPGNHLLRGEAPEAAAGAHLVHLGRDVGHCIGQAPPQHLGLRFDGP